MRIKASDNLTYQQNSSWFRFCKETERSAFTQSLVKQMLDASPKFLEASKSLHGLTKCITFDIVVIV